MSRTVIEAMFDAIDGEDWRRLSDFYAPDCQYERPGFELISGVDELLHFYKELRPISRGKHLIHYTAEEQPIFFSTGTFDGSLRNGSRIDLEFTDIYIFKQRRIHRRKTFFFTPLA
jgi:ketosteroid isomerase-like protein